MIKDIKLLETEILANNWCTLKKITYQCTKKDGSVITLDRETYVRGNGATILLYNQEHKTVILTRQFRMPTYVNGNESGLLIETCAGLMDEDDPEECIRRETEEETGYQIKDIKKVYEAYMSPGSVTELVFFFIGAYSQDMKTSEGGGLEAEQENIEVLELPFEEVMNMIQSGEIRDAKTIMLVQYLRLNGIL